MDSGFRQNDGVYVIPDPRQLAVSPGPAERDPGGGDPESIVNVKMDWPWIDCASRMVHG
jgi:hypothetical protein